MFGARIPGYSTRGDQEGRHVLLAISGISHFRAGYIGSFLLTQDEDI